MTDTILTEAGIQHREAHFSKPPAGAYAVWFESADRGGADDKNLLERVSASIEVYAAKPQHDVLARLEAALDRHAAQMIDGWDSTDLVWLQTEQLYQKTYEFDFYRRVTNE